MQIRDYISFFNGISGASKLCWREAKFGYKWVHQDDLFQLSCSKCQMLAV